jgi:hypothetical protein
MEAHPEDKAGKDKVLYFFCPQPSEEKIKRKRKDERGEYGAKSYPAEIYVPERDCQKKGGKKSHCFFPEQFQSKKILAEDRKNACQSRYELERPDAYSEGGKGKGNK